MDTTSWVGKLLAEGDPGPGNEPLLGAMIVPEGLGWTDGWMDGQMDKSGFGESSLPGAAAAKLEGAAPMGKDERVRV